MALYAFTVFEDRPGAARITTNGVTDDVRNAYAAGRPGKTQVYFGAQLSPETHCFLDYQPAERLKLAPERIEITANGSDAAIVDQLPDGTTAQLFEVVGGRIIPFGGDLATHHLDGSFEFDTAVAGEFELKLDPPFPYQQQLIRIVAHAVQ